ncbi:uncharacterized protein METZ01_LOCUS349250 [marine metagenome]|uniref:Uncharacterized protein n=1 Tax=marine metagenome TaxID=408172 RepID=A0A382RFK2_9ZZZZ
MLKDSRKLGIEELDVLAGGELFLIGLNRPSFIDILDFQNELPSGFLVLIKVVYENIEDMLQLLIGGGTVITNIGKQFIKVSGS